MAILTTAERARIRDLVGWSAKFRQTDSRLEWAMNLIDEEAEQLVIIRGWLTDADTLDSQLKDTVILLQAGKLGSIEPTGLVAIAGIRKLGRSLSSNLASKLGVEIRTDYWGEAGPSGFAGADGMTGGNNLMRQG